VLLALVHLVRAIVAGLVVLARAVVVVVERELLVSRLPTHQSRLMVGWASKVQSAAQLRTMRAVVAVAGLRLLLDSPALVV
jgi:hypothetical protein